MEMNGTIDLLKNCIAKVEQMLAVNQGKFDSNLEEVLKFVLRTLKIMHYNFDKKQALSEELKDDFKKVLMISVRLFEGNNLEDMLWKLNTTID